MSNIIREDAGDGVVVIRLNRPPMNALNSALLGELAELAGELHDDASCKAVVVYGGDSVFAAGADVKEFTPPSSQLARDVARGFHTALNRLEALPRPTIAAIQGYALGGGLELALGCDFRIAGDNARLGFPEIQLGILPGGGGTQRASRLIGAARTKDLVFSGRHIRAQEALEIGLVDEVVSPTDVFDVALARARTYASGAVVAMGLAKRAIDEGLTLGMQQALELEMNSFAESFATGDAARGIDSFLEHGPGRAHFEGN